MSRQNATPRSSQPAKQATMDFVGTEAPSVRKTPAASIKQLREESRGCRACDLWKNAKQTVFGEGAAKPTIMFVGEQPGDQEDLAGTPFVGPAGKLFNEALAEAENKSL